MTSEMNQKDTKEAFGVGMDQLKSEYTQNRDEVIDMLIGGLMQVDTSIPRVVRGHFEELV